MKFKSKSGTKLFGANFNNSLMEGFSLWEQNFTHDVRLLSIQFVKDTDMKKIVIDKENAKKLGYIIEIH